MEPDSDIAREQDRLDLGSGERPSLLGPGVLARVRAVADRIIARARRARGDDSETPEAGQNTPAPA